MLKLKDRELQLVAYSLHVKHGERTAHEAIDTCGSLLIKITNYMRLKLKSLLH